MKHLGMAMGTAAAFGLMAATAVDAAQIIITGQVVPTPDSEVINTTTFQWEFVPTPGPSYGPFTGVTVGESFTLTFDVPDSTVVAANSFVGSPVDLITFEVGSASTLGTGNLRYSYLGGFSFPASIQQDGNLNLLPSGYKIPSGNINVELPVLTTDTLLTDLAGSYAQSFDFIMESASAGFGTPPERLTFSATNAVITPEPASLALLGLGGLALIRRR